jgi:hypothetical protein
MFAIPIEKRSLLAKASLLSMRSCNKHRKELRMVQVNKHWKSRGFYSIIKSKHGCSRPIE